MRQDNGQDDNTQSFVALTKGTMVSHYRIIEKIGAGGMGEVYLAKDTELDRKVALKFLPSHLCQDEDCRKRFKREAQAAAKLSHPNIVTIHEVGEHQTRPYFVMEHVEGRSLRDIQAEELDIDRIIGIAIQLCDGLHCAHAAGVTHRDIKPSNIMIDSSGRPKLLDFGLATVKGSEHLTKTGSTLGTVGYMSPEQIEGKETDARSDLFSLGVVLYELIANKSPFRRDDETATLKAILQDAPEPLARYKSDVPDNLQRIVSKLIEKDPTLRYQSAAGVIPDLKKFSSVSTTSLGVEKKRDRWKRYVVPSAVTILLAVCAIWYFGYYDQAPAISSADDRIMLAVLPFENLGNPEDEYFADGVTEEITSRLAAVHSLGIISRTSAYSYKNTDKTLPQIALELGVDYILEGTLRWDKTGDSSKVLVTPQLIDVTADIHLWSDRYERSLSDVFSVQRDIAMHVVDALNVSLVKKDTLTLAKQPTVSTVAYEYYLQGREHMNGIQMEKAINSFERAIETDPAFAEAHAYLSLTYVQLARGDSDFAFKALHSAEKALEIDPDIGEGHLALGVYHYNVRTDYERAATELVLALENKPKNSYALLFLGLTRRRQGHWDEAQYMLAQAIKVDPLNSQVLGNYIGTSFLTGRLDEPISIVTDMVLRFPDQLDFRWAKAQLTARRDGPSSRLRDEIRSIASLLCTDSPSIPDLGTTKLLSGLAMYVRDYSTVRRILAHVHSHWRPDAFGSDLGSYYADMGELNHYINLPVESKIYFDSARIDYETWMAKGAEHGKIYAQLGLAEIYAALKQRDKALAILDTLYDYSDRAKDAYFRIQVEVVEIRVHLLLSDYDLAVSQLEKIMKETCYIAVTDLQYHPRWDPLRDHPRFRALIEKYEKEHGT